MNKDVDELNTTTRLPSEERTSVGPSQLQSHNGCLLTTSDVHPMDVVTVHCNDPILVPNNHVVRMSVGHPTDVMYALLK